MIGVGPTSTGAFGSTYSQNQYELHAYYAAIDKGEFPILRGYRLNEDDEIRREIIFSLMCRQRVDFNLIGYKYGINVLNYFDDEINDLNPRLAVLDSGILTVTNEGRFLLRNICKLFDVKDTKAEHLKIAQLSMTRRTA